MRRAILFLAIPIAIACGCKTSDNPITPIQKKKYPVQYTVVNTGDTSLWSCIIYALIYSPDEDVTTFDADAFNGVRQYDSLYIRHDSLCYRGCQTEMSVLVYLLPNYHARRFVMPRDTVKINAPYVRVFYWPRDTIRYAEVRPW